MRTGNFCREPREPSRTYGLLPRILSYGLLISLLLITSASPLSAFDWGLQLNQTLDAEGVTDESNDILYSASLIPWLSTPLGPAGSKAGKLYLSAGISILYTSEYTDKTTFFVPELLRTEFSWRTGAGHEIRLGRMLYSDPLGFIASGLFDGARFSFAVKNNTLGAGVWYTGLLYKRNAIITMKNDELLSYHQELDYKNFGNTYFAPRRLMAAFDWENPYLAPWLRLKASLIGQFDLSGSDELYHSQYLALRASIPVHSFLFDLGGCFGLAQNSGSNNVSLAGELGIGWALPTRITDQLKLSGRFTSGNHSTGTKDSSLAAFVPVTTVSQGDILKAKLSGLSMIRLEYTARLHETFSFNLASSYFILSDSETYQGFSEVSSAKLDGRFLGNEFSGRLVWSPFSDLQFYLGGGIFLPVMGNAASGSGALWRIELNAALAIF